MQYAIPHATLCNAIIYIMPTLCYMSKVLSSTYDVNLVINLSSSSHNSPPINDGSPTTITSCDVKPNVPTGRPGDIFFLFAALFVEATALAAVDVVGVEDLRFGVLRLGFAVELPSRKKIT